MYFVSSLVKRKAKKSPLHSPPLKSEYQISTRATKCMHAHAVCFCLLPPLLLRMQTESVEHSPDHVLSACFQACHYVVCYWRYLKRLFDSQKYSNAISFTMWLCDTWPHPQSHKNCQGNESGNATLQRSVEISTTVQAGGEILQNVPSFE